MLEKLLDGGYLPTTVIRAGIRQQLRQRLTSIASTSNASAYDTKMKYVELLRERPIAIETSKANTQHYEVGTGVLNNMLGPNMKYSCCLYEGLKPGEGLGEAELLMMEDYVKKADLKDGMTMFDLGWEIRTYQTDSTKKANREQMWMGVAQSVPRRQVPQLQDYWLLEFAYAEGVH